MNNTRELKIGDIVKDKNHCGYYKVTKILKGNVGESQLEPELFEDNCDDFRREEEYTDPVLLSPCDESGKLDLMEELYWVEADQIHEVYDECELHLYWVGTYIDPGYFHA